MSDFHFPLAAAAVLLVLFSLILLHYFRARHIAPRKKFQESSGYTDSNGYFCVPDVLEACEGNAGSAGGHTGAAGVTASDAGGGDGGGD